MTPQQAYERCYAEIDADKLYTTLEAGELLGLHMCNVSRAIKEKKLPERLVRLGSRKKQYALFGSEILAFAQERAEAVESSPGVIANALSGNAKLGRAATTLVARQSCPTSCAFREKGCYAEYDNNRVHWDRITAGAAHKSPLQLAAAEAEAIDGLPADRDLRLHVAGDSTTIAGTQHIAAACARYMDRGRVPLVIRRGRRDPAFRARRPHVWAYTHAWREVPREAWGRVSILASCETADDVREAHARGYAAALVVSQFDQDAAYEVDGVKVVPCPQQTRDKTCTECRLCFNEARLRGAGLAIGFAIHGGGSAKAQKALRRVPLPMAG